MIRSVDTPTIAASAVAGVRHLLIEENVWAAVRAELVRTHADATGWIDSELSVDPTKTPWVPVAHHAQMMDALIAVVGRDRTYEFGRLRAHRTAQAGAFAPVVRSWSRSFGASPSSSGSRCTLGRRRRRTSARSRSASRGRATRASS
jgi:hypothetical protein